MISALTRGIFTKNQPITMKGLSTRAKLAKEYPNGIQVVKSYENSDTKEDSKENDTNISD